MKFDVEEWIIVKIVDKVSEYCFSVDNNVILFKSKESYWLISVIIGLGDDDKVIVFVLFKWVNFFEEW